jgi:hypothetical protein
MSNYPVSLQDDSRYHASFTSLIPHLPYDRKPREGNETSCNAIEVTRTLPTACSWKYLLILTFLSMALELVLATRSTRLSRIPEFALLIKNALETHVVKYINGSIHLTRVGELLRSGEVSPSGS